MSLTKKDLQDIGKLVTDITSVLNDALEKRLKNDIYKFKDEILGEIQNLRDDIQVTRCQDLFFLFASRDRIL